MSLVVRLEADQLQELARLVADELERRRETAVAANGPTSLMSLDEFAGALSERMPARTERQWARWAYENAPRGRVPGARKSAGRWWFTTAALEQLTGHEPADEKEVRS